MAGYADWNAFTTYNVNDVVNYQGFLYVALQISLNRSPPSYPTFWASTSGPGGGVTSLNTLGGAVNLVSLTPSLTIAPSGQNITFAVTPSVAVNSLNSQTGSVTLASSGGTVAITNPSPGVINLEQSGGTGTLTGITAGTGIAVSGSAPSPTVSNTGVLSVAVSSGLSSTGGQTPTLSNTGVLSLTAGNNIQLSSPTGSVIIAAQTPIPMSFSIGGPFGFPIPGGTSSIGYITLNTLTTFGNLLTGSGAFVGVNSGFIMIDLNAYSLSMVSGNTGPIQVRVRRTGDAIFSLAPVNIIYPPNVPSTAEVDFSIGYAIIDLSQFRAAYGTNSNNANLEICLLNNNTNTVYPAGNTGNSIAWFYPNTIV